MALRRLTSCLNNLYGRRLSEISTQQYCAYPYTAHKSKVIPTSKDWDTLKKAERYTQSEVCDAIYEMSRKEFKRIINNPKFDPSTVSVSNQGYFDSLYGRVDQLLMTFSTGKIINLILSLKYLKHYIKDREILTKLERQARDRLDVLTFSQAVNLLKSAKHESTSDELHKELLIGAESRIKTLLKEEPGLNNLIVGLQLVSKKILPASSLEEFEEMMFSLLSDYQLSKTKKVDNPTITNTSVQNIDPHELDISYCNLCQLFVLLSQNKRRPIPLLKVASDIFVDIPYYDSFGFTSSFQIDTLSALSNMNYPEHRVIDRILKDLYANNFCEHLSANHISTLLQTLAKLRWLQPNIMNECIKKFKDKADDFKPSDLVALISTCAILNYKPQELMSAYEDRIAHNVSKEQLGSASLWLKYVWSLVILDLASEDHMRSILNTSFFESLRNEESKKSKSPSPSTDTIRLLNLRSIATHSMNLKDIDMPQFESSVDLSQAKSTSLQLFSERIKSAINKFMPKNCMRTDVDTNHGFNIDILLVTNSKFEPLPIENADALPEGYFKSALMLTGLNESIANRPQELIGSRKIQEKILNACCINVVFLPQPTLSTVKVGLDLTLTLKRLISAKVIGHR